MAQAKAHHDLLRARSVPLQSTLKTLGGNEMKESEPSAFRFIKGKPLNACMNPAYATRAGQPKPQAVGWKTVVVWRNAYVQHKTESYLRATCRIFP